MEILIKSLKQREKKDVFQERETKLIRAWNWKLTFDLNKIEIVDGSFNR